MEGPPSRSIAVSIAPSLKLFGVCRPRIADCRVQPSSIVYVYLSTLILRCKIGCIRIQWPCLRLFYFSFYPLCVLFLFKLLLFAIIVL